MGFPIHWRNWVSMLLSTVSTKVLLNNTPGERIYHGRGLRQGDPLSPMLFLLVMEALSGLIHRVEAWSLLQPLPSCLIPYRASLYADDLILFLNPVATDLQFFKCILTMFENASGLDYNLGKCQIVPIRCDESQVQLVQQLFPCPIA
jgi:hypothetical protein